MTLTMQLLCFLSFVALGQTQNWNFPRNPQSPSCTTPNAKPGRCIAANHCGPFAAILQARPLSNQALQYLTSSQCGFQGVSPLVCCANDNAEFPDPSNPWFQPAASTLAPPTPSPVRPPNQVPTRPRSPTRTFQEEGEEDTGSVGDAVSSIENHPNRGLLPNLECGRDFTKRIFGGNVTDLDEFPWTALLRYRSRDGREKLLCGGVLISRRYVLTAAHCSNSGNLDGNRLVGVRLGEYDTSKAVDCEESHNGGVQVCAKAPINYEIEQEIAHPDYLKNSINQFNDIALLRLNNDVLFNTNYIKPICLPTATELLSRAYVGQSLTVAGWGRTENGTNSPIKLKVQVPVIDNSQCSTVYASKRRQIINSQLCAGGVKSQDSCNGDSGGPLMSVEKLTTDNQLRYHVTGIVSYGPTPCGQQGWPGVYTKVAEYSGWILDQMRP